jgi:hypothetical protein
VSKFLYLKGIEKASCEASLFWIDNDNLSTLGSAGANPASSPSAVAFGDSRVLLSHSLFHFLGQGIKKASCEAFFFWIDNCNLSTLGSVRAKPASSLTAVATSDSRILLSHSLFHFLGQGIKKASCEAFLFWIDNDNLAASYSPI